MAKAATATKPAETAEQPSFDFSHMPFKVSLGLAIPEIPQRGPRSGGLPFRSMFEGFLPAALAGQKPSFFVPVAFFRDRPNVNADNLKPAYVRSKLRDQFKAWQEEKNASEETLAERLKVGLVLINRDGIDEGSKMAAKEAGVDPQEGVSVWMVKTADGE